MSSLAQRRVQHAIERAAERYGVRLTAEEFRLLERRLAAGMGMRLRYLADGSEYWAITAQGVAMVAVWWPENANGAGEIATFLPPKATAGVSRTTCGQSRWPNSAARDRFYAIRRKRKRRG